MSKPFNQLRERLLRAGVAPRYVRRYLTELDDHLTDLRTEEERAGLSRVDAESVALSRLGGMEELAQAMISQRHFQSWCVQAPWAVFGFGPLAFLAGAYFFACVYLWCGWNIFMPGADSPFGVSGGPLRGFSNWYFQAGKGYYFCAPVLIGWGIGFVAARQRLKAFWPIVGFVLIAFMGGAAQIHASRTAIPDSLGHISMDFAFGSSTQDIIYSLLHASVILMFTAVPYFVWRLQKARRVLA